MSDAVLLRALIVASRLAIAGTGITRAAHHPGRYARYLAARVLLRVPRRDPDGEPLDRDEMRAFTGLVEIFPASGHASGTEPDVNQHLIGVCLAVYAGCALAGILPAAVLAAKARQPVLAAAAVLVAAATAAVLANGAADLW